MARVLSMRQRGVTDANEEVCRGQMMDLWAIKELELYPMGNMKPLKQCFFNVASY